MKRALPARANLEHLKSQAKDLLEAFRRGDAVARQRFREALPAAHGCNEAQLSALELALHDAQSVIAREYGFKSFSELKAAVEKPTPSSASLQELLQRQLSTPLPAELLEAIRGVSALPRADLATLPAELPIIPLRNAVLVKGALAPLMIGRAESRAAVEAALAGDGWLGVFTQKDVETSAPELGELHLVGSAAKVLVTRPLDAGLALVVRGEEWLELRAISRRSPYLQGVTSRFELRKREDLETLPALRKLRERASVAAAQLPDGQSLVTLVQNLGAQDLSDAVIANLPVSVEEKARYAREADPGRRLELALELMEGQSAPAAP